MLIRFSIIVESGIEIFSYEPKNAKMPLNNPQLIAGFMTAMQNISEHFDNPIQQIQFSNMLLYIRTYGNFCLQLLLEKKMDESRLEQYFEKLAKEVISISGDKFSGPIKCEPEVFEKKFLPILAPLFEDPLQGTELLDETFAKPVSKIAIVGMAKAGKTSIKNMFFKRWTLEMAIKVQPTIGVDILNHFLDFLGERVVVMDYGGQVAFRKSYLSNEEMWRGTSVVIFVIDLQDENLFEEAENYLKEIWEIILKTNDKKPELSIFFHKCDYKVRGELKENIRKAMEHFIDFSEIATFHLTTIEDNSSNIAFIKTLYFSLSDIFLRKLLEDKFLNYVEQEILPQFSSIYSDDYEKVFHEMKSKIRQSAVRFGLNFGLKMQEEWMKFLIDDWVPQTRLLSSKSLSVARKGPNLFLTLPNWTDQGIPNSFTTTLFDGVLEGVLNTFHLDPPEIIQNDEIEVTWKIAL